MFFQTCMHFFLHNTKEDILKLSNQTTLEHIDYHSKKKICFDKLSFWVTWGW